MRHLLRILFNALTVLLLALAIAVAAVLIGSYWRSGYVVRLPTENGRFAHSQSAVMWGRGTLIIDLIRSPDGDKEVERRLEWRMMPVGDRSGGSPFRWPTVKTNGPLARIQATQTLITVGLWLPLLLLSLLPLIRGGFWMRQKRRRVRGGCAACGYDMRATPARCPECGATPGTAELSI